MNVMASSFLDKLQSAVTRADAAESELRKEIAARLKTIESDRMFAYRRLNLMRAVAEGVVAAESEEIAIANSLGVLRSKLGWSSDSEPRQAVLSNFAPVGKAVFLSLAPPEAEAPEADVIATLTQFENWYAEKHGTPFWILFENYIRETPVVDF